LNRKGHLKSLPDWYIEKLSRLRPWAERLADAAPFVMESRRSLSDYLCGDGR
jgi:hypothetical protein